MRDFLPGALDKSGYVNVRNTLQVDVSRCGADLSERVTRNLFAIGDVANAGVIKAGHTGWNQVRPRHVLSLVHSLKLTEFLCTPGWSCRPEHHVPDRDRRGQRHPSSVDAP